MFGFDGQRTRKERAVLKALAQSYNMQAISPTVVATRAGLPEAEVNTILKRLQAMQPKALVRGRARRGVGGIRWQITDAGREILDKHH